MPLGAQQRSVLQMVLRESPVLVAIGALLGVSAAAPGRTRPHRCAPARTRAHPAPQLSPAPLSADTPQ